MTPFTATASSARHDGLRPGYGGGYFDRTLASYERRPLCSGPGFETARMDTIFPRPHDVPLDSIVAESRIRQRKYEGLEPVEEDASDRKAADLLASIGGFGRKPAPA